MKELYLTVSDVHRNISQVSLVFKRILHFDSQENSGRVRLLKRLQHKLGRTLQVKEAGVQIHESRKGWRDFVAKVYHLEFSTGKPIQWCKCSFYLPLKG